MCNVYVMNMRDRMTECKRRDLDSRLIDERERERERRDFEGSCNVFERDREGEGY